MRLQGDALCMLDCSLCFGFHGTNDVSALKESNVGLAMGIAGAGLWIPAVYR